MNSKHVDAVVWSQKQFFSSGATLSYEARMNALSKLESAIKKHEQEIYTALNTDLGKSETESFMCEVGLVQSEISWMKKNLKKLMKRQKVKTPMSQFAADSFRSPSPYGTVLIMSPWNYPVLVSLSPMVAALAAGNTVVLKPSSYSPATSGVIQAMLEDAFPSEYVCVITGGRTENESLLQSLRKFALSLVNILCKIRITGKLSMRSIIGVFWDLSIRKRSFTEGVAMIPAVALNLRL